MLPQIGQRGDIQHLRMMISLDSARSFSLKYPQKTHAVKNKAMCAEKTQMKILVQNQVVKFIRTTLTSKLQKDYSGFPFRIFREEDLHTCTYYHLRRFLKADRNWEILNEPFLRDLKAKGRSAQPDIVLFHKGKPKILIELKFKKYIRGIQKKDKKVLEKSVENKKWAKKAFFIQAIIDPKKETDQDVVPYRNTFITIEMKEGRKEKYLEIYHKRRKPQPRKRT